VAHLIPGVRHLEEIMSKKFLSGILFGFGFAIAFSIVMLTLLYFYRDNYECVKKVDAINMNVSVDNKPRFMGTAFRYHGGFWGGLTNTIDNGEGKILGKVFGDGKPIENLKLRLVLNRESFSPWVSTDSNGSYAISVPFGTYTINGYELDIDSANRVLAGLTERPQMSGSKSEFIVNSFGAGDGLTLNYVKPIDKYTKGQVFDIQDDIVLTWEAYENASTYRISVFKKANPESTSQDYVIGWPVITDVSSSEINLDKYKDLLKPGNYYEFKVIALDEDGRHISKSISKYKEYDFRIM